MSSSINGIYGSNEVDRLVGFLNSTGFEIIQRNGQRICGPPPGCNGPLPRKGSEVFVGKLPRDCFEDELVPFMEKIGKVYELRLMMDFSGTNRGFAFVMYTNPEDATKAVKELNNCEIRPGRTVGVVKSVNNCRLFVGGLPKSKTKEEIKEALSKIVEGIQEVILYSCVNDKRKSRGFAFLEFDSHRSAAMARRILLSGKPKPWSCELAFDWAVPEIDISEEVMSKVTILYIRNLMLCTSEEVIKDVFEKAGKGNVEKVKKIRDFAFVHFETRKAAECAFRSMNGKKLDGSELVVTWAKPVNKNMYQMHKAWMKNNAEKKYGRSGNVASHSQQVGLLTNSFSNLGIYNVPPRARETPARCRRPGPHQTSSAIDSIHMLMPMPSEAVASSYSMNMSNPEEASGYMVPPTPRNGFDQAMTGANTILNRQLEMAAAHHSPNSIHPDIALAYSMTAAGYYLHAPNRIPAYDPGMCCDGCYYLPNSSGDGIV